MKDFEWRKRFAPNGYYQIKERLSFESIQRAYSPQDVIQLTVDRMERMLELKCPYFFDPTQRETRVTVWPKEIGESVNHLDPLKPRFGIEIELRQPVI